jgi:hypothetical protein
VRVSRQRDEAERLAKPTMSARSAKQARQKATFRAPVAERGEFVSLPESWLDRIQLGFPRANSW